MRRNRHTERDLLRIISMLMVVLGHFFSHGGLMDGTLVPWTANWFLGNVMYTLCLVAVSCCSGYAESIS